MKAYAVKPLVVLLLCGGMALAFLTSYTGGAAHGGAGNRTGSPGSAGTCANCHGGGQGITTCSLVVRRAGDPDTAAEVTRYNAGQAYTISLRGTNALQDAFGFQITVLNASHAHVGGFSNLSPDCRVFPDAAPQFVEHLTRIAKDSADGFTVKFDWIAPAQAIGPITIWAIVNAVNANSQPSFDQPGVPVSRVLDGDTPTSISQPPYSSPPFIYPNPFFEAFTLAAMEPAAVGQLAYVVDAAGRRILQWHVRESENRISTREWPSGPYWLWIGGECHLLLKQ